MVDLTRRDLLAGLLAGVALPVWAEAPLTSPRPPRRPVKAAPPTETDLIAAAKLGGVVGFAVADLATGRVLALGNADLMLPPASVNKAVTALYALEKLGSSHRFTTRVMRTGPIVEGRLNGDLILAGGGDPTFDTDSMGDLVASLASSGLREVTGRFLAFGGALPERDRIAADQPDHVGYNPAMSGLMLNYNRVNFAWKRNGKDWQLAMDARGERFVPLVKMARVRLAARNAPTFAYEAGADQTEQWTVAEAALGKEGSRWLPVRHPAAYTAEVFQTLCAAHGIALKPAEIIPALPVAAQTIVHHQSQPLTDLLRDMLRYSTNLTAEAVGLAASSAISQEASAAAMTDWAAQTFGIAGVFGDHSGLGPASRTTPADMMQVLMRARTTVTGPMLMAILREKGLLGPDGKEVPNSPARVHAKSGTLNFVSCLAGYVVAPGISAAAPDRTLAFAIFCADEPRRDALGLEDREDPAGGSAWTRRARRLQGQLIAGWAKAHLTA